MLDGRVFTKLSLVKLKKIFTCSSNFLNNFIKKALVLNNGCNQLIQYIVQYPICWPLGRTAK